MNELHNILNSHHRKLQPKTGMKKKGIPEPSTSEIPDLFFDEILVDTKLSRIEILVLMYLYRQVWCRPNLYKTYGISPIMSHSEVSAKLEIELEDLHQAIRKLESFNFIETIRSGQYFVRKYFTEKNDKQYGQYYDDF
jgi:DNA-binding MarR family transcriptional regulator